MEKIIWGIKDWIRQKHTPSFFSDDFGHTLACFLRVSDMRIWFSNGIKVEVKSPLTVLEVDPLAVISWASTAMVFSSLAFPVRGLSCIRKALVSDRMITIQRLDVCSWTFCPLIHGIPDGVCSIVAMSRKSHFIVSPSIRN